MNLNLVSSNCFAENRKSFFLVLNFFRATRDLPGFAKINKFQIIFVQTFAVSSFMVFEPSLCLEVGKFWKFLRLCSTKKFQSDYMEATNVQKSPLFSSYFSSQWLTYISKKILHCSHGMLQPDFTPDF